MAKYSCPHLGMLALEMLGRRAHNDHPNNFSRSPPYTEDVKWLLGLAARLGMPIYLCNMAFRKNKSFKISFYFLLPAKIAEIDCKWFVGSLPCLQRTRGDSTASLQQSYWHFDVFPLTLSFIPCWLQHVASFHGAKCYNWKCRNRKYFCQVQARHLMKWLVGLLALLMVHTDMDVYPN